MKDEDFKKLFLNNTLLKFQQNMLPNQYLFKNLGSIFNQNQMIGSYLSNFAQLAGISKSIQTSTLFSSAYLDSLKYYRSSLYEIPDLPKVLSSISLPIKIQENFAFNFSELIKTQTKISQVFGSSVFKDFHLASERILDSIASLQATIKVCNLPNELIIRSFEISNSYQHFAKRQYNYAEKNESILETVITVTDYAGDMVIANQSATELGCELLINSSEYESYNGGVLLSNRSNIFPMLNLHLSYLYRSDTGKIDILNAIESSIPALINRLGCQIIELVYRINSYFQGKDGSCIFKPSNKTFYAASVLSSFVASNETGFAEIIDFLFFLLYEGSGAVNRLMPISNDEQLKPVWLIKHFRQEFRHDLEHGDKIEKKLKNAGDAFREIISKSKPINTIDWKKAQVRLYELVVIMLSEILIKLENVESSSVS